MSKRTIVVGSAILLVIAVIIGTVVALGALKPKEQDPYKQTETTAPESSEKTVEPEDSSPETSSTDKNQSSSDTGPTLDPSTVGTIDIQAVGITVSYVKGVGGFEYVILRADNGTQYIELRSADLVGTKCTDDMGVFASIIIAPKDYETSTLTKTTTIDGTKYGLSLAGDNCTSDITKLQSYQKSFSDAFSLLKKTN